MLRVRDLCMSFDRQQVLYGVNLDLREGQVVLLRGPNGSGKTTLVNILTGYLTPDQGELRLFTNNGAEENFVFPRRWWHDLNPWDHFLPERVAHEGICRSWQDTRLFRSLPLVDNVAVSDPRNHAENPINVIFRPSLSRQAEAAINQKAAKTLAGFGLNGRGKSSAEMVSLGQSKRVAIARATGTGARILFLDEPLAGLDGPGIHSVVDLLSQLVDKQRMALVLVEHVSSVHHLLPMVDTIWDLSEGRLTETSKTASSGDSAFNESNIGIQRMTDGMTLAGSQVLPGGATLEIYRLPDRRASEPVLQVRDLVVHRGRRLVIGEKEKTGNRINGVDLTLHTGDLAVLQAPNGWGKTTLLDCIAGLHSPTGGTVHLWNTNTKDLPCWKRVKLGVRYLRSARYSFPSLTVEEYSKLVSGTIDDFSEISRRICGKLSGGEYKLLYIRNLFTSNARFLMLDEPFSALDHVRLNQVTSKLLAMLQTEATLLIALPSKSNLNLRNTND